MAYCFGQLNVLIGDTSLSPNYSAPIIVNASRSQVDGLQTLAHVRVRDKTKWQNGFMEMYKTIVIIKYKIKNQGDTRIFLGSFN